MPSGGGGGGGGGGTAAPCSGSRTAELFCEDSNGCVNVGTFAGDTLEGAEACARSLGCRAAGTDPPDSAEFCAFERTTHFRQVFTNRSEDARRCAASFSPPGTPLHPAPEDGDCHALRRELGL